MSDTPLTYTNSHRLQSRTIENGYPRLPIEIGLIMAGRFSPLERRLLQTVVTRFNLALTEHLPQFDWRIAVSQRRDMATSLRVEPTELLRQATEERDLYHWDYAMVLLSEEPVAHYRSFALATLSRPLDAAVISTARLIPDADGPGADHDQADETEMVDRIVTLLLRSLAHLAGLKDSQNPHDLLYRPNSPGDLAHMQSLSDDQRLELDKSLTEIADLRLEESTRGKRSPWRFLLRACYINREQIVETIVAARPWQFPRRLSRLTTAAVSTVTLLLMSAESWDLGLAQSWTSLSIISLLILCLMTMYISFRQHLLLTRSDNYREQIAVTRASAIGIVFCGLALTWAFMLCIAVLAISLLFPAELIAQWATLQSAQNTTISAQSFLKMATFCASLGLLIGALGASFEEQTHFQHVIFVDDEL